MDEEGAVLIIFAELRLEASSYLQGLYYSGWVVPDMYYAGATSVDQYYGIRIFTKGKHQSPHT